MNSENFVDVVLLLFVVVDAVVVVVVAKKKFLPHYLRILKRDAIIYESSPKCEQICQINVIL
jgi:hypothetical protein